MSEASANSSNTGNTIADSTAAESTAPIPKIVWWAAAVYGLLAAGAALTVSEIFAAAALSVPSLVVAVGDQVIDSSWMPMWFDEWTKELFEVEDDSVTSERRKNALIAGVVITTLVVGVVVGLLSRRSAASRSGISEENSNRKQPDAAEGFWQQMKSVWLSVRQRIKQAWRQRHLWLSPLAFAVFGTLGGLAAAARPGSSAVLSGVSAGLAAFAGFAVLHVLTSYFPVYAKSSVGEGRGAEASDAISGAASGSSRRRFLVTAGASTLALGIANILGSALSRRVNVEASREGELVGGALEQARSRGTSPSTTLGGTSTAAPTTSAPSASQPSTTAPAETTSAPPVTATLPPNLNNVTNISPLITPNTDFYLIDTALQKPAIQAEDWSLSVQGMVDNPATYSFAELLDGRFSFIQEAVTLSCVSNRVGGRLVGNAVWEGVPLKEVLDASGVQPGADQISGRSVDDWASGFPTELAYDGRVAMIAVTMNGEPLPVKHGFPARLVIAGLYGYVSATKWLSEINLTTWEGFDSYWVPRGWAKEGPIKTQSRIDVPSDRAEVPVGDMVAIAGVAWAPNKSIDRVEVQVGDSPWVEAELSAELSTNSWRQWVYYWEATPGEHLIQVRATDGTGYTQTSERRPPAPDGATGWHMKTVRGV